jgi:hypothetical protein
VRKFTNIQPLIRHGLLAGGKARANMRMKVKKNLG